MTDRLKFVEVEHEWGTTHHFEYKGNRIQEYEVAEMFNELYKKRRNLNLKFKQLSPKNLNYLPMIMAMTHYLNFSTMK